MNDERCVYLIYWDIAQVTQDVFFEAASLIVIAHDPPLFQPAPDAKGIFNRVADWSLKAPRFAKRAGLLFCGSQVHGREMADRDVDGSTVLVKSDEPRFRARRIYSQSKPVTHGQRITVFSRH